MKNITESPPAGPVVLIRRTDAARELQISERTLDRWLADPDIPLERTKTSRPGVWLLQEQVDALKTQRGA